MRRANYFLAAVSPLALAACGHARGADGGKGELTLAELGKKTQQNANEFYVALRAPLLASMFEDTPIASVDGTPIALRELTAALAATHSGRVEGAAGSENYATVLARLITAHLVAREAREMGIDELDEVKADVEAYRSRTLREMLKARVADAVQADPKVADRIYAGLAREVKIRSLLFGKEVDALAMVKALAGGGVFAELAAAAVERKEAKGGDEGQFVRFQALQPAVARAVEALPANTKVGQVAVEAGVAVFMVEDRRQAEDAKLRADAERQARSQGQHEALEKYYDGLVARHCSIDARLVKRLDFEGQKPSFNDLMQDTRPLVTLKDGPPITVSDLAKKLGEKYFHGIESAVREKKLNREKEAALRTLMLKRVTAAQAAADRLDHDPEFVRGLAEYEQGLLFAHFVQRAVAPEIRISDESVRAYYESHTQEYMYPEFFRLSTLAFDTLEAAEKALAQIRAGTDMVWVRQNAAGQSAAEKRAIDLNGTVTLARSTLQQGLAEALTGARAGDARLYADPQGPFYLVFVHEYLPPKPQDLSEVQDSVREHLYRDAVNASLADWAKKLREAYPVLVYVTGVGR